MAKILSTQSEFRMFHALCSASDLRASEKRRKISLFPKQTLRTRFTLSRAYESCLACQHFVSNLMKQGKRLETYDFVMHRTRFIGLLRGNQKSMF